MDRPQKLMVARVRSQIAVLLAALVVGCMALETDRPALDQARAAVERARSAPRVRALAADELDRAEVALQGAETAATAGAPANHVDHLAFVATQHAALAEAHAANRVAQSEIQVLERAFGPVLADTRQDDPKPDRPATAALRAAAIDVTPTELALELAELQFDDTERPSPETARELGEVADSLTRGPERTVSLQADFELPDPVARTAMEHRVEMVRAELRRRGIEASRIIVRAGDEEASSFVQPERAASLFVDADRAASSSVEPERAASEASPAAAVDVPSPELALELADLQFDDTEQPSPEAAIALGEVAERLMREPGRTVSLQADFGLPDPVARTAMEHRVEMVRAELRRRGIEASRIVVRAREEQAASSFVEPAP